MKLQKITALSLCTLFTLSSCGSKEETAAQNEAAKTTTETAANATTAAPQQKYKIKSGIITTKMDNLLGGDPIQKVTYFDDHGAVEASETKSQTTMMGITVKTHEIEITKDGYLYKLDLEKKTGTKMKMPNLPTSASGNAMFANLSDADMASDMMKEWNIKKEAPQTIAGKECEVYSMDNKTRQMKGTVATYQGIPMKVDQTMAGMKIKTEVVKFEENAPIPAGIFDVPAGITVEEVKY
ncbi:MAG TPA: hypothetical protein VFH43_14235 [Candidatus Kapabacteria bacterium]|nr:hypothetical protein [Candidatus Kapabacteria bacterium]